MITGPNSRRSQAQTQKSNRISSLCFPGPGIATRQNGSIPAKTTNLYQARIISSIVSRSLFPRGPVLSAPPTAVIAPNNLSVCDTKPTRSPGMHHIMPATRQHLVSRGCVSVDELRLCPAMLPPISRQVPFPCAEYNTQTI